MIRATYFDGHTTRPRPVKLLMHDGIVAMSGAGFRRTVRMADLVVSEPLAHAPRIMRLPNGGFLEVADPNLAAVLAENGYRDSWVVRWQQRWPLSLLALVTLVALLTVGYQWGLPWAADSVAQHLPASLEHKIGDEQLRIIDAGQMQPSRLAPAEQARLKRLFAELKQPDGERTEYRLEFRDSPQGPNAFALPNGVIVMTDQLVALAPGDQALLGVLGHELGHLHRRHSLRSLMQALGVGVVVNLFIGDVSTVLAAAPALLLYQNYSRDFEREADQYAIEMMRDNRIPLSPMADLFEKMKAPVAGDQANNSGYFSSHPSDEERIETLRGADRE
ncbi:MAG: family metallopeptidase [Burkholderia sp.]|jgi:Zn-dependent protease with chaperone function|nr:family metallopeptidase [Burkholderia sp.]